MRDLIGNFFKTTTPAAPPAPSPTAVAVGATPSIQRALHVEAERRAEFDAAEVATGVAALAVAAAGDAVAADERRLKGLEDLAEPTSETLLDEAITRRRLAQRRASLVEAEAVLASAQAASTAAAEGLKTAEAARVRAELNHESDVILADMDAFALEIERRQVEHIQRCGRHGEQTRVSRVPARTSNHGEGGVVSLARRMLMRREEEGLAARGIWSLPKK